MRCRSAVRPLGVAAFALLLGAAAAVPAGAAAQPAAPGEPGAVAPPAPTAPGAPTAAGDVSEAEVALERDLGIPPEEAAGELAEETAAARRERRIRAILGGDFGGAWWDPAVDQLVVATDDPRDVDLVRSAGAVAAVVEHELSELEAVQAVLDGAAGAAGDAVTGWFVDPEANELVITATDAAAGEAFVAAAGVDPALVRVDVVAEDPVATIGIAGGDAISSVAGTCSAGFPARDDDGVLHVLTAGHCTRAAQDWSSAGAPLGPAEGSDYPGDDFGSIEVTAPGWTPLPDVVGLELPVLGTSVATVGTAVCRSGVGSGYQCGIVLARNASVSYGGNIVSGLTKTSACASPGDSGGPYVTAQLALGLHSGASGTCATGGTATWYQPINEVLREYDLRLVTALNP